MFSLEKIGFGLELLYLCWGFFVTICKWDENSCKFYAHKPPVFFFFSFNTDTVYEIKECMVKYT